MKTTPKTPKKSKVTRLTIARLFNLGNYEHVRYEITAEIPRGGSVKQTFLDTLTILARLKPIKKPYDYDSAKAVIQKDPSQRSEYETAHIDEYIAKVAEHAALIQLRNEALIKLDDVGGASHHTDAKNQWDDDPPF